MIADAGLVTLGLDDPLKPVLESVQPLEDGRSVAVQFRYGFVTTARGLEVFDLSRPAQPQPRALLPMADARRLHVARTYAYVAAGHEGLVIVDIEKPGQPQRLYASTFDGHLKDLRDVAVGSTNASLFAYLADAGGLHVVQLTAPDTQPKFYGFSPEPKPQWIATWPSPAPLLALSKGLERDRAVDETGYQIAVFGRIGSRPLNRGEMERLFLDADGTPWFVSD